MSTNQMGLASKSKLTAIANAIRTKLGVSTQYSLDDMPTAIASISGGGGGGITPTGTKQISITQNGTTTEDVTNYASAEITVNVSGGGGADISPYKVVKGTLTPSADTKALSFPCSDIKTVLFCVAVVTDFEDYISSENEGMGLGMWFSSPKSLFNNRTWTGTPSGQKLSVYNGAFDYWTHAAAPTVDETNQIATFSGNNNVTYRAGIPIEYVLMGV